MKTLLLSILLLFISSPFSYASWTEYTNIRYEDLDGDFTKEIIIESRHGAGSNHYIEDIRIFKDRYPQLELIFSVRILDSNYGLIPGGAYDIISEVEFSELNPQNGARDIIVRSKEVRYKDGENKIVDKEVSLWTKVYKWNGKKFVISGK